MQSKKKSTKREREADTWIDDVNRVKVRRDLSKIFHIPYLDRYQEYELNYT